MNKYPCVKVTRRDIENCLVEVEICDNVMTNPCSIYFLDNRNKVVIDDFVPSIIPSEVTSIKLKILPNESGKFYYSLNGIETIIYNLFRSDIKPFERDIKSGDVFLKVFYEVDEFHTLPIIGIQIIFLRKLHPKTIERFWVKLQSEIQLFTTHVGDINTIHLKDENDFRNLLNIPLHVGCPEFKLEGLFIRNRFFEHQIDEMNYIHAIPPMKLDMNNIVNNSRVSLFDDIRSSIKSNQKEKETTETKLHDLVNSIFTHDDGEDLPF